MQAHNLHKLLLTDYFQNICTLITIVIIIIVTKQAQSSKFFCLEQTRHGTLSFGPDWMHAATSRLIFWLLVAVAVLFRGRRWELEAIPPSATVVMQSNCPHGDNVKQRKGFQMMSTGRLFVWLLLIHSIEPSEWESSRSRGAAEREGGGGGSRLL